MVHDYVNEGNCRMDTSIRNSSVLESVYEHEINSEREKKPISNYFNGKSLSLRFKINENSHFNSSKISLNACKCAVNKSDAPHVVGYR